MIEREILNESFRISVNTWTTFGFEVTS